MLNVKYIKLSAVPHQVKEDLARYVRRVRDEKGLSLKKVWQASHKDISRGYISQIENGHVRNPTKDKLRALARGLGVDEDDLFAIARGRELGKTKEGLDKKIADISLKSSRLSGVAKSQAEFLIDMVNRELERLLVLPDEDAASYDDLLDVLIDKKAGTTSQEKLDLIDEVIKLVEDRKSREATEANSN